jgi:integrase
VNSKDAQLRQIELEGEFHTKHSETTLRATRLTDTQVHLAELGFARLSDDADLLRAIDHWIKHGKHQAVSESPRLDEAVKKFKQWLDGTNRNGDGGNGSDGLCTLRERSRSNLRVRTKVFGNSVGNMLVSEISPEVVENFLWKLKVSNVTRDNYRRSLSRFFSWCIQRPRRWTATNPCKEIRIEQEEKDPPTVLTVDQCSNLLRAAEQFKHGRLVPYVAVCLFGGLRPFEAMRLGWRAVNLSDGEIRLEANQTKNRRPRVVAVCGTLNAWLESAKGKEFFPSNWRKDFAELKEQIGYGPEKKEVRTKKPGVRKWETEKVETGLKAWPEDVLRHTAVSHYFRKTGSYGQTAEQFGNSEAIIKAHYQGRVSSEDTEQFYALRPKRIKGKQK